MSLTKKQIEEIRKTAWLQNLEQSSDSYAEPVMINDVLESLCYMALKLLEVKEWAENIAPKTSFGYQQAQVAVQEIINRQDEK